MEQIYRCSARRPADDPEHGAGLPDTVKWGIDNRVTDIMRDMELLKFCHKASLVRISPDTDTAETLKETCRLARNWQPDLVNRAI